VIDTSMSPVRRRTVTSTLCGCRSIDKSMLPLPSDRFTMRSQSIVSGSVACENDTRFVVASTRNPRQASSKR
jgi:hypothetical protein